MLNFLTKIWELNLPRCMPLIALVIGSLCAPSLASASDQSFSGRWRIDTKSVTGDVKPTVFRVVAGQFKRDGIQAVKADGTPTSITGDGYVDEITISIKSDHVIEEVDKIRGKLAYTVGYVVSPDGNTLTSHIASYTSPSGEAVEAETVMRRIGAASNSGHLISGKWQRVSVTVDAKSDDILRLDGKRFSWRTAGGGGYDAIIGGKPVKIDGDNSGSQARITRPRSDLIIETDLSATGEVESVMSLELLPDKRTIRVSGRYGPQKRQTKYYMRKQGNN